MNQAIFNFLFSLTHRSSFFDALTVFLARDLIWFWVIVLAAVAIIYFRRVKTLESLIFSASAVIISWSASQLIKILLGSSRPFVDLPVGSTLLTTGGDAFPSSHASFLFALTISIYLYNRTLGLLTLVVAILVSLARIATGLHWPIDVVGGFVLAFIVVLFLQYLSNKDLLNQR